MDDIREFPAASSAVHLQHLSNQGNQKIQGAKEGNGAEIQGNKGI